MIAANTEIQKIIKEINKYKKGDQNKSFRDRSGLVSTEVTKILKNNKATLDDLKKVSVLIQHLRT